CGASLLENLAIPLRQPAKIARRDAGGAMEGAHEIGQVAEAHIVGDIGDRPLVLGQQPRRTPEPRAHQVLVRRHADDAGEKPQEVELAQAGLGGGAFEIDSRMRLRVDPQRCLDGAAAITWLCRGRAPLLARHQLDEAHGEQQPDFVEADIAAALSGGLRQLAQHHQLRQGGAAPARYASGRSPKASTKAGVNWNDRHSSPQTWSCVHMYSSPGRPTSSDPATSSKERPALSQPKLPLRT